MDQCPNCAGYWLDAGELAQIRAERSETEKTEQARQSSISGEFIRYWIVWKPAARKSLLGHAGVPCASFADFA